MELEHLPRGPQDLQRLTGSAAALTRPTVGRPPGEPRTRWTTAPASRPIVTDATASRPRVAPRNNVPITSAAISTRPNVRNGSVTYGENTASTATSTSATR